MCLPNSLQLMLNFLYDNLFPFLHPHSLGLEFLGCYLLDSGFCGFLCPSCHMRFLSHLQPFCYVSAGGLEDSMVCRLTCFYFYLYLAYNLPSLVLSYCYFCQNGCVIRVVHVRHVVFYILVLLHHTTFWYQYVA